MESQIFSQRENILIPANNMKVTGLGEMLDRFIFVVLSLNSLFKAIGMFIYFRNASPSSSVVWNEFTQEKEMTGTEVP